MIWINRFYLYTKSWYDSLGKFYETVWFIFINIFLWSEVCVRNGLSYDSCSSAMVKMTELALGCLLAGEGQADLYQWVSMSRGSCFVWHHHRCHVITRDTRAVSRANTNKEWEGKVRILVTCNCKVNCPNKLPVPISPPLLCWEWCWCQSHVNTLLHLCYIILTCLHYG